MMWPIVVEFIINGLISNVNQSIINEFSKDAVAAIGSGSQIVVVILNIYGIISIGTSIILAQIIGAKQYEKCSKLINAALIINLILGLSLSIIGVLCIPWLIKIIQIPHELVESTKQYLFISIGLSFLQAILNTLVAVFRSLGYMKKVTITLISVSLICLLLNQLIVLFIPRESQNLMQYASTGCIAQFIGIIIFFTMLRRDKVLHYRFSLVETKSNIRLYSKRILRIGIPGGLEGIIYLIAQTVVVGYIGILGTKLMFTKAIIGNVTYYMSMATSTIGTASGVIIGQLLGAGEINEVKKSVKNNILLTMGLTIIICTVLMIFAPEILSVYSSDIEIIKIGMSVLVINCIFEVVRSIAAIMIVTLKAVGDVDFPFVIVIIGSIINIAASYFFGIYMKMGLEGIWIGYILDVSLRGIVCLIHWKRGKWMKYYVKL